jgi:hypothetical protein
MNDTHDTGGLSDDDIVGSGPTEEQDDRDQGGHGTRDTGDEPTEAGEDRDVGGEGPRDSGDEA